MCSLALSLHKHLYNSIISSCASLKQVANLSSFFYRFHFNSSDVRHSVDNERKKGSISHLRFVTRLSTSSLFWPTYQIWATIYWKVFFPQTMSNIAYFPASRRNLFLVLLFTIWRGNVPVWMFPCNLLFPPWNKAALYCSLLNWMPLLKSLVPCGLQAGL